MRKIGTSFPLKCQRAVRLLLDNEPEHPPRWAAIMSVAAKIGGS